MKLTFLLILILFSISAFPQKRMLLTETRTGKEIILTNGMTVSYLFKRSYEIKNGELLNISDSTFEINGIRLQVRDISAIGLYKKENKTRGYLLCALSGLALGALVLPDNSSVLKISGGIISLSSFVWGERFLFKNSPKDIEKKWQLTIIR